jgi:hypothetical protein
MAGNAQCNCAWAKSFPHRFSKCIGGGKDLAASAKPKTLRVQSVASSEPDGTSSATGEASSPAVDASSEPDGMMGEAGSDDASSAPGEEGSVDVRPPVVNARRKEEKKRNAKQQPETGGSLKRDLEKAGNQIKREGEKVGSVMKRDLDKAGNQMKRDGEKVGNLIKPDLDKVGSVLKRDGEKRDGEKGNGRRGGKVRRVVQSGQLETGSVTAQPEEEEGEEWDAALDTSAENLAVVAVGGKEPKSPPKTKKRSKAETALLSLAAVLSMVVIGAAGMGVVLYGAKAGERAEEGAGAGQKTEEVEGKEEDKRKEGGGREEGGEGGAAVEPSAEKLALVAVGGKEPRLRARARARARDTTTAIPPKPPPKNDNKRPKADSALLTLAAAMGAVAIGAAGVGVGYYGAKSGQKTEEGVGAGRKAEGERGTGQETEEVEGVEAEQTAEEDEGENTRVYADTPKCQICLDSAPESGFACSRGHFVCFECLEGMVDAAAAPQAIRTWDYSGNLYCPDTACRESYNSQRLAIAQCSEALYSKYEQLRTNVYADRQVTLAVGERETQLRLEFEELQRLDLFSRQVHLAKLHIVGNIMTLCCPRSGCHRAFVAFDGCCALTCSDPDCGAAFCAYCLKDCDSDAHAHVSRCGSLYCTPEEFNAHHRERKGRLVCAYLGTLLPNVRRAVCQALALELRELHGEWEYEEGVAPFGVGGGANVNVDEDEDEGTDGDEDEYQGGASDSDEVRNMRQLLNTSACIL